MPPKTIKAVELTRQIRDIHYEQLKNASLEEQIAFYQKKARAFYQQHGLPEPAPTTHLKEASSR